MLDTELESKIAGDPEEADGAVSVSGQAISTRCAPPTASRPWSRPGRVVLDPVGTAPGVMVPGTPTVLVLPGPPRELQPMWRHRHRSCPRFRRPSPAGPSTARTPSGCSGCRSPGWPRPSARRSRTCPASPPWRSPRVCGAARSRWSPATSPTPPTPTPLEQLLRDRHWQQIFSEDGSQIDDQVAQLLTGRRIATAESCTGGLLAARLTDRPGSSAYLAGGLVAYANEAKSDLLGVDPALIDEHGAVSEPVAEAMAAGALRRFGADTAVAITGIAGPGGGTRRQSRWGRSASPWRWPTATTISRTRAAAGQPLRRPGALDDGGDAPAAARAERSQPSGPIADRA